MSTHTPGPWKPKMLSGMPTIMGPDGLHRVADVICYPEKRSTPEGTAEIGANARLIAAAPAMLEALKLLLDIPEKLTTTEHYDYMRNAERIAKHVIAQAEGQAVRT